MLASTIPVTQVINSLLKARKDPASLDIDAAIKTLTDQYRFIGAANVDLSAKRKLLIKRELNSDMKNLANDQEVSSGKLFGEDLTASLKENFELNKVTRKFYGGHSVGKFRGRFNGRKAMRGRFSYRKSPYYSGDRSSRFQGRRPLNRRGPSKA